MRIPTPDPNARGVTLIEFIVVAVVIGGVALGIGAVMQIGVSARGGHSERQVERLAYRAIERITDGLAFAGRETIVIDTGAVASLSYRNHVGTVNGVKQWGSPNAIEWQPDPEDPTDGLDNDGDGAIDEGLVVHLVDPGEPDEIRTVLVSGVRRHLEGEFPNSADDNGNGLVDEPGLSLERDGDVLRIRLTLIRQGSDARRIVRTVESAVALRN